ncbi:MAG: LytTR family DNA-binding domain-containing protein [Saprospiraceae bacterium]|nr:LytTR family DNA-binding domain-containing protein [Saprospiraceae bacterium]
MRVVIIEDETTAAQNLQRILRSHPMEIEVLRVLKSINKSVEWLRDQESKVDLIFMDIKLSDGLSFEIFEQLAVRKPIIFTTAFDEYAIQAFRVNSIDYLLKPVGLAALTRALEKFRQLQLDKQVVVDYQQVFSQLRFNDRQYKSRFLVKSGAVLQAIEIQDIAYFLADGNLVLLKTFQNKSYPVAHSLHKLEDILDPQLFFRVSRNLIIQAKAIHKLVAFSKGRLKLELSPPVSEPIIVSNQKAIGLKTWLDH